MIEHETAVKDQLLQSTVVEQAKAVILPWEDWGPNVITIYVQNAPCQ